MGGLFYCRNFFQFLGEPQFCIVIIATALRPWTRKLFNKAAKHSFIRSFTNCVGGSRTILAIRLRAIIMDSNGRTSSCRSFCNKKIRGLCQRHPLGKAVATMGFGNRKIVIHSIFLSLCISPIFLIFS